MARKPRLHIPGGVYHVMLRGNGGQDVFFNEADRYHFYLLLQEGIARYSHRIHGFCLMPNHVHIAIQVADESLSKIMQNMSFRYTRWINRRKKRVGHLFQGRYKAILVDQDSYLLALVRYIHLNPVRAKIVRQPSAYPWSGHRAYLGRETLPWLETQWVLGQFGKRISTCRQRYEAFIREGRGEGHREEFHKGSEDNRVLGSDKFLASVIDPPVKPDVKIDFTVIMKLVCQSYQLSEKDLASNSRHRTLSEARQIVGWLAQKTNSFTLTEVGERFGRDVTTMSRGVQMLRFRAKEDKQLARRLNQLLNTITQA